MESVLASSLLEQISLSCADGMITEKSERSTSDATQRTQSTPRYGYVGQGRRGDGRGGGQARWRAGGSVGHHGWISTAPQAGGWVKGHGGDQGHRGDARDR